MKTADKSKEDTHCHKKNSPLTNDFFSRKWNGKIVFPERKLNWRGDKNVIKAVSMYSLNKFSV